MESAQHGRIVNFIWGIADDVLHDLYVRGKYRDVILPMVVLRRFVLCTHHHRLIHEGGFTVDGAADGDLRFRRPNGRPVRALARRPVGKITAARVTPGGVSPLSRGEPLDREHAAWTLSSRLTADTG